MNLTVSITLGKVDLNLLLALDALLEHRSVQDAAAQMHVTSPAMSRTLGRLRRVLADDVLVRNGRVMVPTPRATAVRDEVRDLVQRARAVLTQTSQIDLAELHRVFTITGNDALIMTLAPALLSAIDESAPHVAVRFLGEAHVDRSELPRGESDLEVGGDIPGDRSIASSVVGADRPVVVMRTGHPLAAHAEIGEAEFAAATHVAVSRRGRRHGPVDEVLELHGLKRVVIASVPTATTAIAIVRRTDFIAVVGSHLAAAGTGIELRNLPFELPPLPVVITWHHRYDSDPGHRWLRSLVTAALLSALPVCE